MNKQAELKKAAYESKLKSRALNVFIYLVDRSNKELTCFPSIPTMAKSLHISISTVKRALKELENEGFIEKTSRYRENNGGQTSNLYKLIIPEDKSTKENVLTDNDREENNINEQEYIDFNSLDNSKSDSNKNEFENKKDISNNKMDSLMTESRINYTTKKFYMRKNKELKCIENYIGIPP